MVLICCQLDVTVCIVIIQMIYQISRDEETSSSCSECKREQQGLDSYNHNQQSSSDDQPVQLPTSKNPYTSSPPMQHHDETHTLITLLQEEVRQLKINNQGKDRIIKQLRKELKSSRIRPIDVEFTPHSYKQYTKTAKEIPSIRPEGQLSSKRAMMGRVFSPEVKPRIHQQSRFQVVVLENQVKELQLKMMQLNKKLGQYEVECQWMQKFIVSFVHMAEDLSLRYGGGLHSKGQSLRKKTKASWKYVKQLINYLIK